MLVWSKRSGPGLGGGGERAGRSRCRIWVPLAFSIQSGYGNLLQDSIDGHIFPATLYGDINIVGATTTSADQVTASACKDSVVL